MPNMVPQGEPAKRATRWVMCPACHGDRYHVLATPHHRTLDVVCASCKRLLVHSEPLPEEGGP